LGIGGTLLNPNGALDENKAIVFCIEMTQNQLVEFHDGNEEARKNGNCHEAYDIKPLSIPCQMPYESLQSNKILSKNDDEPPQ
jgi:hypothetical protein